MAEITASMVKELREKTDAELDAQPAADPDREPEVLPVAGALEHAVAHPDVLVPHPLEAEVCVAHVEVPGPGEGRVGETPVGE